MNEGRLAVDTTSHVAEDKVESDDLDATEEEIRNLLYGIEHLRKQSTEEEEGQEGES